MSSLLRLTLYFPDRAPSRFAVALRQCSPEALRERVEAVRGRDESLDEEHHHAALLLDLVAAISEHDHTTRGHSERVQAYAALIGKELGLSERDSAKLSWAALLHDVGKLRMSPEILNKSGLPTDEEWELLSTHPSAGMEIAERLAAWLGPWMDAVGQHHERWDGGGYPSGLAGHAISRGARIVAVADAFDAITSARSYKKPMSASAARAELARCSGQQFDPDAVRAFLAVGLGRLQLIAGPASVLSALPRLGSMPNLGSVASSVTTAATTAVVIAATGVIGAMLSVTGSASAGDRAVPTVSLAANTDTAVGSPQRAFDRIADPGASSWASPTASPATSPTASPATSPTVPPRPQPTADTAPSKGAAPSSGSTSPPTTSRPPSRRPPIRLRRRAPEPSPVPRPWQERTCPDATSPASP